jgi:hypothetical protein
MFELEKLGVDARALPDQVAGVGPSRVIDPDEANASLSYVVSEDKIAETRMLPGAVQLARAKPRPTTDGDLPLAPTGRMIVGVTQGHPVTRRDRSHRAGQNVSGPGWIRTTVGCAGRFTVCSLWPLGHRPWDGTR